MFRDREYEKVGLNCLGFRCCGIVFNAFADVDTVEFDFCSLKF